MTMQDFTNEYIEESNLERIKMEMTIKAMERELERKEEALKTALFMNGTKAIESFLDCSLDPNLDKDAIDNALDQKIESMSLQEFDDWCYFLKV